jgi:uncharacterized caspase-like protein
MYRVWIFVIACICLVATSASAERRVAMVLGNSAYKYAVALPNPAGDAQAMADLLKSLGFEVVLGVNLGREAMAEKLSEFAGVSGGADVAAFFYAGHGIQLGGKNLLIPVDADLKNELDAKMRTIEIDSVLQNTMADAKVKLVLLDACRDNPFATQIKDAAPKTRSVVVSTGLAEMRSGEGTLIAFATGPGEVAADGDAKHSPFTRALLTHLAEPGVEIRHALTLVRAQVANETRKQQLPWENTNLTGFFYMANASSDAGAAVQPMAQQASRSAASGADTRATLELELWNSVKGSKSADEYKAYVEKFPNGTFADLARSRIASLNSPNPAALPSAASTDGEIKTAEASAATEDALGLNSDGWRDIQTRLAGLGFGSRGGANGRVGDGTRRALTSWQSARGYPSSGYLNLLQREALLKEAVPANAPVTRSTRVRDETDGESRPRRRTVENPGKSDGSAGQVGELIGGIARGVSRGNIPFFGR